MRLSTLVQRLLGALGVGGLATLVDLVSLTALVELLGLTPAQANLPALVLGASVQFLGCRKVVFRTSAHSLSRQLMAFTAVELVTLALNAALFSSLILVLPDFYPLMRILSTFLVFIGFSFPAWHWAFGESEAAE